MNESRTMVTKPLCPRIIHDETIGLIVSVIGIILCSFALYRILKYYNS